MCCPESGGSPCCVAVMACGLGLEWVKKSYGYPVRCRSEPDIPTWHYGRGVPEGDPTFAFEGLPASSVRVSIALGSEDAPNVSLSVVQYFLTNNLSGTSPIFLPKWMRKTKYSLCQARRPVCRIAKIDQHFEGCWEMIERASREPAVECDYKNNPVLGQRRNNCGTRHLHNRLGQFLNPGAALGIWGTIDGLRRLYDIPGHPVS